MLPTFFVGVSAPARIDRDVAIETVRRAVDLAAGWVGVDVTWSTFVSVDADDPGTSMKKMTRPGLDWEFASSRPGMAQTISLTAVCTELEPFPWRPDHVVAEVSARFPVFVAGQGREVGRMSVTVSVQRWAMYGSGENMRWIAGPAGPWVQQSTEVIGADSGYAILDRVRASDTESPLELHSTVPVAGFGSEPDLWGFGWGTLLSPSHLERIGGVGVLTGVAGAEVHDLPGGRVWVTLGDDPSAVTDETMWGLHAALQPAFPAPRVRWVASPRVAEPPSTVQGVHAAWGADADAARAAGRLRGAFGPVGFTVEAAVPDAVVQSATAFSGDLIMFEGLGAQAAGALLDRLPAEVLDHRVGPGPTLRTALRAAAGHPGVVRLTGHAVGPAREDERVTVDGVHIYDDPVLAHLGAGDLDRAWLRVQELGIDDASATPDELRPPSTPDAPWTVWWD
ncbi:hypothetical protein [Cellulomonas sp. URHD0024]|uniref:hypothetical protein n=1 Tax=Cellulomonas sp. URHD0024 TaxID=1302620 RepID=UPI0012DECFEB|nr:hypothetical protein [Cellulomonas sp. URHD0024]